MTKSEPLLPEQLDEMRYRILVIRGQVSEPFAKLVGVEDLANHLVGPVVRVNIRINRQLTV